MAGSTLAPSAAAAAAAIPGPPTTPTTPTAPSPHGGRPPRGLERSPQSSLSLGRFGRMFRNLPVYEHRVETLLELGRLMIEPLASDGKLDEPLGTVDPDENVSPLGGQLRLPAGYTYFGQFVDHDITFDPVSSLTRQNDPDGLTNFRTPRFDLDSVYGRGPSDQPYLYDADGLHLRLGDAVAGPPAVSGPDLLRVPTTTTATDEDHRAIIGDPRNDENLIVSQLQVTVVKFHNAVVDELGPQHPALSKDDLLKLVQKTVRWHYQWVVIHDFLRRLVGERTIDAILVRDPITAAQGNGGAPVLYDPHLRFYHWNVEPYMPVEFAVAAYRFGHSMVRPSYFINDIAKTSPDIPGVSRIRLFVRGGSELQSLNGFRPLPGFWGFQWKYFLSGINDEAGDRDEHLPQPSYRIDAALSNPLGELTDATAGAEALSPGSPPNLAQVLAVRNLLRGRELGVPSGQAVARAMGLTPLSDAKLLTRQAGGDLSPAAKADLAGNAPLWYYVLKEADVLAGGAHLGPVGGRIVAEVLIGLLVGDPLSYINVEPAWKPHLPGAALKGDYTLSDLVNFAIAPGRTRFAVG